MPIPENPEDIPRLFAEHWNAKDAKALASLFAEDADFVNVVGLWWHKRADIERAHAYGLSTFFSQSEVSLRRVKLRWIGNSAAIVHARFKLIGQIDKDGRRLGERAAIMSYVVQRDDHGWQILAAQNTDIVPGAETNASRSSGLTAMSYREPPTEP